MSETSEDRTVWSTPRDREQAALALRYGMRMAREAAEGEATYRTMVQLLRIAADVLPPEHYAAFQRAVERAAAKEADEQG